MRLVLDASIVVELVLGSALGLRARARINVEPSDLHAPHLMPLEAVSALRTLAHLGKVEPQRAEQAVADIQNLRIEAWPSDGHLQRIWQLRSQLTAYDAAYVVLAERLDAVLVTADQRLARVAPTASGCRVEVFC